MLEGGPGNDLIGTRDRARGDHIRCGPGRDRVIADHGDTRSFEAGTLYVDDAPFRTSVDFSVNIKAETPGRCPAA